MTGGQLLIAGILAYGAGAVLTAILSQKRLLCGWVAFATAVLGSIWTMQVALSVFADGPLHVPTYLTTPYFNQDLVLTVDPTSAVFLFITALLAVSSTLFSVRYMMQHEKYDLVRYYPPLLMFFGSIVALLSVHNLLYFVIFWELMTLASWVLVVFETESTEASRSALIYFIASHVATGLMIAAILVLHVHTPNASFEFSAIREAIGGLLLTSPAVVHLAMGLFVVAAATKAGILPFGFWLPHAHPVAPSPFSAVLSGCMVKMGVYRALLVFTVLLPVTAASTIWGIVLALLGTGSLVVGTITALRQHDSKRLLAFHTIGQMGYIWLGLGVGVAFLPIDARLATLGLVAGLFHAVNHAAFKSLLFLNAGAAAYRTGTRDMDRAGGLVHIMPLTTITAVIAALSIGGIPGFNGFASKWLIFESSIFGGLTIPVMIILGLLAIFISAITLASFLKFLGMLFLGDLIVAPEVQRREVPAGMVVAQYIPAVVCVLFGLLPLLPIGYLHGAAGSVMSGMTPSMGALFGMKAPVISLGIFAGGISGAWGPLTVALVFVLCLVGAAIIGRVGASSTRSVPVWLCGEKHRVEEFKYPVHSFLLTFNRCFTWMYPSVGLPKMSAPRSLLRAFGVHSTGDVTTRPVRNTQPAESVR